MFESPPRNYSAIEMSQKKEEKKKRRKEEKKEDVEMEGKSAEQGTAKVGNANGPDAGIGAGPKLI